MQVLFWNGVCYVYALRRYQTLTSTVAALIFAFFVFSIVPDLLPSVRTKKRVPQGEKYMKPETVMRPRGPIDF